MRQTAGIFLLCTLPQLAAAETVSAFGLSDQYELLAPVDSSSILVVDQGKYLVCQLNGQENWIELAGCLPIMTSPERTKLGATEDLAKIEARLGAVDADTDNAAFNSLFAETPCETDLGRDPAYEPVVYEIDTDPDDGLPPPQTNLPSFDAIETRDRRVEVFGRKLGFADDEIQLLAEKLHFRLNWLVRDAMERGVVSELRPGFFKHNEECS